MTRRAFAWPSSGSVSRTLLVRVRLLRRLAARRAARRGVAVEFEARLAGLYGGQRLAPPEDCGGTRIYMEEGDPRWRTWWETLPREDLRRMAEAVQRFLDAGGNRSVIGDREGSVATLQVL